MAKIMTARRKRRETSNGKIRSLMDYIKNRAAFYPIGPIKKKKKKPATHQSVLKLCIVAYKTNQAKSNLSGY